MTSGPTDHLGLPTPTLARDEMEDSATTGGSVKLFPGWESRESARQTERALNRHRTRLLFLRDPPFRTEAYLNAYAAGSLALFIAALLMRAPSCLKLAVQPSLGLAGKGLR